MLHQTILRQGTEAHEHFSADIEQLLAEARAKLSRRDAIDNPYGIPADEPASSPGDAVRLGVLRVLAAVLITFALFGGGVAAMVAPTPAVAMPAHAILL
jgi:hypothetical protein